MQKTYSGKSGGFILLNRAGGYRRAKVVIRNLQVVGIEYNPQVEENAVLEPEDNARNLKKNQRYKITNCWLLSGQMLIF